MTFMPQPSPYLASLDGLRGLAAYMVVVSHVSNVTGLWGNLLGTGGGQVGVMIFFVLSGFLIGRLYLDRAFNGSTLWDYAVRRFARVVPLFYVVVTLALIAGEIAAVTGVNLAIYPITPTQSLAHYGFLSGLGVLWTIPVEIHFYLIFVALWWLNAKSSWAFVATCAALMTIYWLLPIQVPGDNRIFPYYLVFFLAGLLASRAIPTRPSSVSNGWWSIALAPLFLLPFLLYPNIYALVFPKTGWLLQNDLQQMWHDPRYAIAAVLCLVAALCSRPVVALLSTRIATMLGAVSYSVYLLHHPIIDLLDRFTSLRGQPLLFLAVTLLLVTLTASVTYFAVERPLRLLITRRLAGPKEQASPNAGTTLAGA